VPFAESPTLPWASSAITSSATVISVNPSSWPEAERAEQTERMIKIWNKDLLNICLILPGEELDYSMNIYVFIENF
jgi:hypothetical protein